MNEYLTVSQLANIYPYCRTTILRIISRGEFAPYREGNNIIKILYCDETIKLLEHFIAIKQKKRGRKCRTD